MRKGGAHLVSNDQSQDSPAAVGGGSGLPSSGTAGAPAAGTFVAGQEVQDTSSRVWVCTASGTPGTWKLESASATDSRIPSGIAGGSLAGIYPDPTIAAGSISTTELSFDPATQVELDAVSATIPVAVFFGDASDGVINFDGSTTVLGLVPSSNVYTLTRDIYLDTGSQMSGTASIITAGYRIFCRGTFTTGASTVIQWDGPAGSGATAGGAQTTGVLQGGSAGGAGGAGGAGTAGTAVNGLGGTGGRGGTSTGSGSGPSGGTMALTGAMSLPRNAFDALWLYRRGVTNPIWWAGGTGGGGGTSAASSTGGGGGGGAGLVAVYVQNFVHGGIIRAKGGAGGAASGAGTGAGGGGGGGGGGIVLVYATKTGAGTTDVTGGTGGAIQGAGQVGADGAVGNVYAVKVT